MRFSFQLIYSDIGNCVHQHVKALFRSYLIRHQGAVEVVAGLPGRS